jgi:pimeloyl-ACP methyl ester carboxylesterase
MIGSTPRPALRPVPLELPGRGTTVVWDSGARDSGGPALVLLHGVAMTAALNWSGVLPALARRYRVVLFDQRGHGEPLRRGPFRLEDCADDVAAVAARLGIDRVVPVGYSMGGLVAQLVWRRHRRLTAGLVLCSTSRNVAGSPWERSVAMALPGWLAAAAFVPGMHALRADVVGTALLDRDTDPADRERAVAQMRRTTLLDALGAVQAVCSFSSHSWIGGVDVPVAVVITRDDRVVAPARQHKLARAIPGSTVVEVDGGHDVFLEAPGRFATALLTACAAVTEADLGDGVAGAG